MQADPARMVATPVLRCDAEALAGFLEDRRHGRVGATTAVFDRAGPGALLLQGGDPLYRRGRSGRTRRSRSSITSGSTPTARGARGLRRAGRSGRSRPGRGSSSSASWRTACRCIASRSRRAAGPSGSSTTRATCRASKRSCSGSGNHDLGGALPLSPGESHLKNGASLSG